MEALTS